ncbi:MAG: pyridoxamine 5'-phosphate oxidase family protein [Holophagaceae bacterium]|nr:pyridoxamine 5'-phosphate oxidase family protein [Holophagaceae bacterium]
MAPKPAPTLQDSLVAFLHGGLALYVASRGRDNLPGMSRALACHFTPDQRRLTVVLARSQSAQVLADIRANGAIALVASEPSTHRSLQVKGTDAVVQEGTALGEVPRVNAHREGFVAETVPLGYPERLIRALLDCADEDLAAVTFTPTEGFVQTPGLSAGDPLGGGA